MKSEKEPWTLKEKIGTFADTPHEGHAIIDGFCAGLAEGSRVERPKKYDDESHYYSVGWSIGEIYDRITNQHKIDTKVALAQLAGRAVKYVIIAGISAGVIHIL